MNYKLPILSVGVAAALTIYVLSDGATQALDNKEVVESARVAAPADEAAGVGGQELVQRASHALLRMPGLEARTLQSVEIFHQKLTGAGTYRQLTNGPKLYLDLEVKLHVADQVRSIRQISDGDSLWEVQTQGNAQTFSHVNLGRLREAAIKTQVQLPPMYWMALGGLPRLLAKLNESFEFRPPQALTVDGHPVWQVEGQWNRAALARMLPHQQEAILAGHEADLAELPEQVPHGVMLILGRDNVIPLFPYSISFYRDELPEEGLEASQQRRWMVNWKLREVRFRPDLRPSDFDFRPNSQEVQERTDHYVARLQAAAKNLPARQ